MPERQATRPSTRSAPRPQSPLRDLLLGLGAFVGFVALSLALLATFNPSMRWALMRSLAPSGGRQPLELLVLHTNDTWGYTSACG